MTRRAFLVEYAKNIREVGAIAPSSRYLAHKMCEPINFKDAKVIVEYGPGTGVFSSEIVKRMIPGTKLLVIESNRAFHNKLRAQFQESDAVIVEHGNAQDVATMLKKHRLANPDVVVSGLPFAALPSEMSHAILSTTAELLASNGAFVTFQYTLLKKGLIGQYFNTIKTTRELRNIPPAYILHCQNTDHAQL